MISLSQHVSSWALLTFNTHIMNNLTHRLTPFTSSRMAESPPTTCHIITSEVMVQEHQYCHE